MSRREDVDPPGVDFIVGTVEPGRDEDLPQPGADGPSARSRLRIGFVVLIVIAVLGALIVRGVATHQPNPVAATTANASTPAPELSPVGEVPGSGVPVSDVPVSGVPVVIRDEPSHGPQRCPRADNGRSLCTYATTVDARVLAAVRSRFRGARITSVLDEKLRDIGYGSPGPWYRSIHAVRGSTRITVVVRVVRVDDLPVHSSEEDPDGSRTTIAVQKITPSFAVRVSASAPSAHLPSFLTLSALAGDPRLVG